MILILDKWMESIQDTKHLCPAILCRWIPILLWKFFTNCHFFLFSCTVTHSLFLFSQMQKCLSLSFLTVIRITLSIIRNTLSVIRRIWSVIFRTCYWVFIGFISASFYVFFICLFRYFLRFLFYNFFVGFSVSVLVSM